MSKKLLVSVFFLVALGLFLPDLIHLVKGKQSSTAIDPGFRNYISGFTSGIISRESTIQIVLTNDYPQTIASNEPITEELFDFSPSISGKTYWKNNRTIEFRPSEPLSSGQEYQVEFKLSALFKVEDKLSALEFGFKVMDQAYENTVEGFKTYNKKDLRWQKLMGAIYTADAAEPEAVEKMMTAIQENSIRKISWIHTGERRVHQYVVDSIERKDEEGNLVLKMNGSLINAKQSQEQIVKIPSLSDFSITSIKVMQSPEQYVSVQFSDPLLEKQNLDGLVSIAGLNDLKYMIDENEIRIFPSMRQQGKRMLSLSPGVKNILGFPIKSVFAQEVTFEEIKPGVRIAGKGVILPDSKNLTLPFEAVNLNAVDVTVIKIYENNIAQFLQVNSMDGEEEIKRVGKIVLKKRMPLNLSNKNDYSNWSRYSIDLSELMKAEPGAIYRVTIGFKKEYSLFECSDVTLNPSNAEPLTEMNLLEEENSTSDWDYYSYGYYEGEYDYDEDYDWNQRDNPCNSSYYRSNRSVSRNVLASDLGLIAKGGDNGNMLLVVTNLLTANPVANAEIDLFDFQGQKIATVKSNQEGMAILDLKRKPFLLVARSGDQKGYLKLDDGSSLSLSQFDVSGDAVHKGIKGFIYGERGVWRPGDTLFLNFILEDKLKSLPHDHPVSLELSNPQGQLVTKLLQTNGVNGFYNFTTRTYPDAPTGNWTAKVKVGGATFTKNIKIETIMPNRLKLDLKVGGEKLSLATKEIRANLKVNWLHGSPGRNLKSNVTVTLSPLRTSFPKYSKFIFDDPARHIESEPVTVFEGRTDNEGHASFNVDLGLREEAPGMLKANFSIRAFEEGGNFSIDKFSVPYSPFSAYVGILPPEGNKRTGLLTTDKDHLVQVVTIDEDGKPIAKNNLKVEVYKVNWRWWWQKEDNELAGFLGRTEHEPVFTTRINTSGGKGSFNFRVNYPDWGRYYVRVSDPEGGHSTGSTMYIDWPDWAGRSKKDNETGATMLAFSSEKENYTVGESIRLNIPTSKTGRALVTVETGSKVINAWWIDVVSNETKFEIKTTPEMAPNVFVYVTYIQPHGQTQNDLPIRMYGVIPIKVENPGTHLLPVIKMPEVLVPEEAASITVREEKGKAMAYTIAVVDEGLLDLTRFKTPDPWNHFYAREALGVHTWDLYDDVMGAYAARLERLLRIGGDEDVSKKGDAKANRFKPMVKFFGPFYLKKGESQTTTFKVPQYVGSVRTMVIAGDAGAYGFAEKTTPVRKPLMVLGTLPRVVSPGETVSLPVTVFAMEKGINKVNVEVVANEFFSFGDGNKKEIEFSETGDQVIDFRMKVKPRPGVGTVKIIATSGKQRAEYPVEIDVRIANPKNVNITEAMIEPGKTVSLNYEPAGMQGTNKGMIEVSTIPALDLGSRLDYLISYPHGCIEQTTSSVFPQLVLNNFLELDQDMKKRIEINVKAGIQRIRSFQQGNGGLTYWPGTGSADDWGTTYAGHFMMVAEKQGYQLPPGFKDSWIKFQKQRAQDWIAGKKNFNDDLMQAYRLYSLAIANAPDLSSMNRLKEKGKLSVAARWKLASAYVLAGQPEAANSLVTNAPVMVPDYNELSYSYGSDERDEAMILETLSLLGDRVKASALAKDVSKILSNESWLSTQTTAYCLLAMGEFMGKYKPSGLNFSFCLNSKGNIDQSSQSAVKQIKMGAQDLRSGKVDLMNKTNSVMFVRIIMEGVPESGKETENESNLKMETRYTDLKGNSISPENLSQGTDFIAEVKVQNPGMRGTYEQLALNQLFPSGWEIHNARLFDETMPKNATFDYQDIRDDRVYTYFKLKPGETKIFKVQLNAAYNGNFYLPSVSCEAMYDNSISSRKKGRWIEVSDDKPLN